jgi:hypothetical protein
MFDIPVALFLFKRTNTLDKIVMQINKIMPKRLYLIADGGRSEEEDKLCQKCRRYTESLIKKEIKVIKNYAIENRGVYKNIGLGAKWVFEREQYAIFLEDDNLPTDTFFEYCKELLYKYKEESKVLWICGTNYLQKYEKNESYIFTRHMLPCGWASWSDKFLKYYDGNLEGMSDHKKMKIYKKSYFEKGCRSRKLYLSQLYSLQRTKYLLNTNIGKASWDYQMNFSVRSNSFFGISPCFNQINNIGVDENSIHGGNTHKGLIKYFCDIPVYNIELPLIHPKEIELDTIYETRVNNILVNSWRGAFKHALAAPIKAIIGLDKYASLSEWYKNKKK